MKIVSPWIRSANVGGLVVLLDLRSGEYIALDEVASLMWEHLSDSGEEPELLESLVRRFDVSRDQLETDLRVFRQDCQEKGFLGGKDEIAPPVAGDFKSVLFPTLLAWLCLLNTWRSLPRAGFPAVYKACQRLPGVREPGKAATLDASLQAFIRAQNFVPMITAPHDCLPRSLALFQFLRRMGFPAEHCIGVKPYPFEAHAWVECGGTVLLDHNYRGREYTTIARIGI